MILIGIVLLIWSLSLISCIPEDNPTPANYEDYVDAQDKYPKFSPDGEYIAYYHYSSEFPEPQVYPSGLYIIDKDGGNRQLVLEGHHENPDWSPDGQWLVFSSRGVFQKCKINGDSLTRFSGLDHLDYPKFYFPDWSPDGRDILFDKHLGSDWGFYDTTYDFQNAGRVFGLETFGIYPQSSPLGVQST